MNVPSPPPQAVRGRPLGFPVPVDQRLVDEVFLDRGERGESPGIDGDNDAGGYVLQPDKGWERFHPLIVGFA